MSRTIGVHVSTLVKSQIAIGVEGLKIVWREVSPAKVTVFAVFVESDPVASFIARLGLITAGHSLSYCFSHGQVLFLCVNGQKIADSSVWGHNISLAPVTRRRIIQYVVFVTKSVYTFQGCA